MPTIEELYKSKQTELGVDKIAAGASYDNLPGGYYSGDQTPYSLGTGYSGKKDIDEDGLKKVEKLNAKGNRYQVGEFGGGYPNAKGYTDKKKYSDSTK
jgi:hypothetical protein